jgi:hypothetical protein
VTRWGVEFWFEGDWVIWVWWWVRDAPEKPYLSVGLEGSYTTLSEIRQAWEEMARVFVEIGKDEETCNQ